MSNFCYTLEQLAQKLAVECVGDSATKITGLATLASAVPGQLSFLSNSHYTSVLQSTQASAVIVAPDLVKDSPCACLVSDNPYLTYAKASHWFVEPSASAGIHPSAVISDSAVIAAGVSIAAQCYIGENVRIGENTQIGPGCSIGDNSTIGSDTLLHANVSIYHRVIIGDQVVIHSTAVIGSDGFGFASSEQGWTKIAQLGGVRIGNRVEVGAGTTIDRGSLDDTVIGDNVILDNQVLLAHNVRIGDHTAIAGGAGIAGSTTVGKRCTIAGGVGIIGHLNVVDDVHLTVCSLVSKSITKPGSYSSGTHIQETGPWRKNAVRFSQLDAMHKRIKELEKKSNSGSD